MQTELLKQVNVLKLHSSLNIRSASTTAIRDKTKLPFRGALSQKGKRRYPVDKRKKVAAYVDLLQKSAFSLFIRHDGLSVANLSSFRSDIKSLPASDLKLTVLRATLLPPVLRSLPQLPSQQLQDHLGGSMMVVTSQAKQLEPSVLKGFLRVYDKHARKLNVKAPDATKQQKVAVKEAPKPTAAQKINLLTGMVESREFDPAGLRLVSQLPNLDTIRAQIVGVIEGSMQSIVATLQRASGAALVGTLQGYERTLQEAADQTRSAST